jgi:CHAT domain-containing protein
VANGEAAGLPRLHFVDQEAEEIGRILGSEPLLGMQATESALRDAAAEAGIIHISAHGVLLAHEPLLSHLALRGDAQEDGQLQVHEVYSLRLPKTDLVVLSACDTQPGAADAGDDVVGLNRAFLSVGASSVVATLWSVDEAATTALMDSFYRNIAAGMGKAHALAAAQADLRKAHPEWRHPYYWAAFVLSGDPGPVAQAQGGLMRPWLVWGVSALAPLLVMTVVFLLRRRRAAQGRS